MSLYGARTVAAGPRIAMLAAAAAMAGSCAMAPATETGRQAVGSTADARIDAVAEILRIADRRLDQDGALGRYLESPDPTIRRWAARAVGQIGSAPHRDALLELVSDADTAVAATAAYALGRLPADAATVTSLSGLLASGVPRGTAAYEAAFSLGRLGTPDAAAAIDEWLRAAEPDDPSARVVAPAALLAVWRFERAVDPELVSRWLGDDDAELRWRAAYALVRRPVPAALPIVAARIGDPDPRVRALAARFLASTVVDSAGSSRDEARGSLRRLAADADPRVRIHALRSLGGYPDEASETFARGIGDVEPHVRLVAVEAVGARGGDAAVSLLRAVVEDPDERPEIRRVALEQLAILDDSAFRAVVEPFWGSAEWRDRAAAMRGVVLAGMMNAAEWGWRDRDVRVATATVRSLVAAGDAGHGMLRRVATEFADAPDPERRRIAAEAIGAAPSAGTVATLPSLFERARLEEDSRAMLGVLDAAAAAEEHGIAILDRLLALPPPRNALVRRRAIERFGREAEVRWGGWRPVDTGRDRSWYRALAERTLALGRDGTVRAVLETSHGAVELALSPDAAPITIASLVDLAEAGFFDGQEWPRVVPAFVAQGGDPHGDTSGGPGYTLRDEINRLRYRRGTIGMAHSGPDTAGSQFFVAFLPQPHLDGDYTVVGWVVDGIAALERALPGDGIDQIRIIDEWRSR